MPSFLRHGPSLRSTLVALASAALLTACGQSPTGPVASPHVSIAAPAVHATPAPLHDEALDAGSCRSGYNVWTHSCTDGF